MSSSPAAKAPAVLFVCLGNICRSPGAEAVLRSLVTRQRLVGWTIDSAGTGAWHRGDPPDRRAIREGSKRGHDLSALRARQVSAADFARFTHILAMDHDNLEALEAMRPSAGPAPRLFLAAAGHGPHAVPDPYYGNARDFVAMFDTLEAAMADLLPRLQAENG